MNLSNALGFLGLGVLMHVAPTIAPGLVSSSATVDPQSRSSLWLYFMSYVVGGIGSSYVAYDSYMRLAAVLAKVQLPALLRPAGAKRPAEGVAAVVRISG